MSITIEVKGLEEVIKRLSDPGVKPVATKHMEDAARYIEGRTKASDRMPVDMGRLRASITSEVRDVGDDIVGAVGSNVVYAPYMEYGTGLLSDGPNPSGKRHWPPAAALDRWAYLHGFGKNGGFLVARAIGLRGGLRPRRFLRTAFVESMPKVADILARILGDVLENMTK